MSTQSFINDQDTHEVSPMFFTVENGRETVTGKVLTARCNVDLQEENESTPLYVVVHQGHEDVTKLLITVRCNIDLQTTF